MDPSLPSDFEHYHVYMDDFLSSDLVEIVLGLFVCFIFKVEM